MTPDTWQLVGLGALIFAVIVFMFVMIPAMVRLCAINAAYGWHVGKLLFFREFVKEGRSGTTEREEETPGGQRPEAGD